MHVYLPTTLTQLATVLEQRKVGPAPLDGFAITPGLRDALAGEDDEELEYAASNRAADASFVRLLGEPAAPRRRVVLVADVDPSAVDDLDGLEVGAVVVREVLAFSEVVSALVDDPSAETHVARALADLDDAEARSDLEDHQLLWFATQEFPDVVAG